MSDATRERSLTGLLDDLFIALHTRGDMTLRPIERDLANMDAQRIRCEIESRFGTLPSATRQPVAWMRDMGGGPTFTTNPLTATDGNGWKPLYTASATRQFPTVEEREAARWRWLFGENGRNIMVAVKLREKTTGDMHDGDTRKFGALNLGRGVFPTALFEAMVDCLMSGVPLEKAEHEAILDSDVSPAPRRSSTR